MATELVIVHHCDACLADGTKTPAVFAAQMAHASDDGRPETLEVEVCEQHAAALRDAWALVSSYGTAPAGLPPVTLPPHPQGDGGDLDCPRCGNAYRGRSALRSHLRGRHRLGPVEAQALLPPAKKRSLVDPTQCEIPGCSFMAVSKTGLIAHVRSTHPEEYEAFRNTDAGRKI